MESPNTVGDFIRSLEGVDYIGTDSDSQIDKSRSLVPSPKSIEGVILECYQDSKNGQVTSMIYEAKVRDNFGYIRQKRHIFLTEEFKNIDVNSFLREFYSHLWDREIYFDEKEDTHPFAVNVRLVYSQVYTQLYHDDSKEFDTKLKGVINDFKNKIDG